MLALPTLCGATPQVAGEDSVILSGPEAPEIAPIINGAKATSSDHPMAGAILADMGIPYGASTVHVRSLICSSTLIAPDVVLAAAHCIDEDVLAPSVVGPGGELDSLKFRWTRKSNLTDFNGQSAMEPDWPNDAIKVELAVFHNKWDFAAMSSNLGVSKNYDVALLFLSEPVYDVEPAVLPTEEEAAQLEEGLDVMVVGWGMQEAGVPWELPDADSYAIKQHGTSHIAELGNAEFKVGEEEDDVRKCHGDSGGPTFVEVDTESAVTERIIGVTSHAYDYTDCFLTGGVDTRVDFYLDWIDGEMRAACEDGTRAWCDTEGILPPPHADGTPGYLEPEETAAACAAIPAGQAAGWLAMVSLACCRRRTR